VSLADFSLSAKVADELGALEMNRFANGWLAERDIRLGARVRLFCLPHAGSGSAAFYRWKRLLPGIDVCPVLLPGREMRLSEESRVDAVAGEGISGCTVRDLRAQHGVSAGI
jgi:hypothetical protein